MSAATRRTRDGLGARAVAGLGAVAVGGAGLVAGVLVRQPPAVAAVLARQRRVVVAARTRAREVALTFDDGPHPTLTPRALAALARHDARATFFLLGSRVDAHPAAARALVEAGHEPGNHGWADEPAVLQPTGRYLHDLGRTSAAIRSATRAVPVLSRPGSGLVRPAQLRGAASLGLTTVLGSVAVLDDEVTDVDGATAFVLDRIRPGSVVVLHEGLDARHRVVDLLERLLPELATRGYRCVTVSELLAGADATAGAQSSIS